MKLLALFIAGSGLFWVGYLLALIIESNSTHQVFLEGEVDYQTMQEDTLAYAAPDPVVKKRGRPPKVKA